MVIHFSVEMVLLLVTLRQTFPYIQESGHHLRG